MVNSREKGARSEREIANLLREKYGFDQCRRGQQFSGLHGDADIVGVPFLHCEIKNVQREAVRTWMKQSIRDAQEGEIPVVMHKKDREPWLVTLGIDDFMQFFRAWLKEWEE